MSLTIEVQTIPLKEDKDGVMRIGSSRVTLDTVVHAFEQGHIAEEIVSHYPVLRLADVYTVIAYYLNNQTEVQVYLNQQQRDVQKIWQQIESKPDHQSFRERIRTRHQTDTDLAN